MKIRFNALALCIILTTLFCARESVDSGTADLSARQASGNSEIRIRDIPVAVQCWTYRKFSFFEALEKIHALGISAVQAYPGQVLYRGNDKVRMDPTLSDEEIQNVKKRLEALGMTLASFGVVAMENGEEMRAVFEFAKKLSIPILVAEPGLDDYPVLEKLVKEYDIRVAIHNHPYPSTYSRPEVVLSRISGRDPRIGVCGDTGHWMRTGLRPLDALRMLEGRMIDMHLKDLDAFGVMDARDVPYCSGEADIPAILGELTRQNYRGTLTVEYENEDESENPSPSVLKGIEAVRRITHYRGYEELIGWQDGRFNKHGWNHYGPGHFELDEKTGILKSQGGMGLLWFSRKMYKDFVLELEFKCFEPATNSGVFLRVPALPVSDDYIYHSFEIQIYNAGEGIHKTGAVYDAEPPAADAFRPAGEWNACVIVFEGRHIRVELNGVEVVDWEAEPKGKVVDFSRKGYIGLQNHDSESPVYFRNIFIKEL